MIRIEGIDHVALAVSDVERSVSWYESVLGLRRVHQEVWGSYPAVLEVGITAVALFPVESATPQPPPTRDPFAMRHLAFRVDRANFERARTELQQRGIAYDFQDHEIAHSLYFHDPDGHGLEITTYDLESPAA